MVLLDPGAFIDKPPPIILALPLTVNALEPVIVVPILKLPDR